MSQLLFHSTNGQSPAVNLREAFLRGQAPDRGLYFPQSVPKLAPDEISAFSKLPYHEIAFRVLRKFTEGIVPDDALAAMCHEAYNFPFAARNHSRPYFFAATGSRPDRVVQRFCRANDGAIIRTIFARRKPASHNSHGDERRPPARRSRTRFTTFPACVSLFCFRLPKSATARRKLMTTLRDNIRTVAIDGKFDDCQAMVKRAFADADLKHIPLSSANSINIGRLLPQSVYYFYAASRLAKNGEPIVFSVPSGNFGDMMGAVVAREMGLPVKKIIASVNDNDSFPRFLASGVYQKISPSRNSVSNAMNVGHPSNLVRLLAVYGGQMDETGKIHKQPDLAAMRHDIFSSSISDARTRAALKSFWDQYQLLLEPHGAVAWQGFQDWLATESLDGLPAVIVETANPAKFPEEIQKMMNWEPDVPANMAASLKCRKILTGWTRITRSSRLI
ncbi:MAG: hypothetical protein WDM76_09310 [Limisphaerales bacterium]